MNDCIMGGGGGKEKRAFPSRVFREKSSFPLGYNVLSSFTSDILSGIRFRVNESEKRERCTYFLLWKMYKIYREIVQDGEYN